MLLVFAEKSRYYLYLLGEYTEISWKSVFARGLLNCLAINGAYVRMRIAFHVNLIIGCQIEMREVLYLYIRSILLANP